MLGILEAWLGVLTAHESIFKLSAQDSERAFEALERSPARNLNMLAKEVFLQFLANQDGQAGHLSGIAQQLEEIRAQQQEIVDMQRAADPDTQLSMVAALFLLMYRSVNVNARAELDEIFNSDAVINYLKQEG